MITNNFNKELRGISDALRDLGYAVLPLLMTYMGHRSVQATSQYIHLSAESFPAILKQSEALFGNLIPLEDISNETSI